MMPPTAGQTERFFLQRQQHRMPRTSSHHGITPGQQPLWKDRLRHKNGTVNTRHELQPRRYPLAQGDEPSAWTHKRWERDPMPRSAPLHHPSSHPTAPDVCVHPKLTTPPNQLSKRKKKNTNAISPLIKRSSASPSRRRRSHSRSSSSLDASVPFSPPSSPVASSSPPAPALPKW
jgi:hypothetical protein